MKSTLIIFLLVFNCTCSASEIMKVFDGAKKISTALEKGDWSVALNAMDPRYLSHLGITQKDLKEKVEELKMQFLESGVKFSKSIPRLPQKIIELKSYRLAFVTTEIAMTMKETKVTGEGLLIAVKYQGQNEWKYLDASSMPRSAILSFYSELPKDVVIPKVRIEIEK